MVERRVLCQKGKRSHQTAAIAKPNHPRRADVPFRVAAQVHHVPTNDQGAGGERAHGDEMEGGVLDGEMVVDGHKDGEADDGEGGAEGDEGGAKTCEVGEVGYYEAEDEGGGEGGNGVELRFDG